MEGAIYRTVWRWHFYAGLFVMPMVLILAVTGSFFLWKPQIDRWEERAFQNLQTGNAVVPSAQRDAALAAYPGSTFSSYRLPERPGDAALVHVALPGHRGMRDVFVSPKGNVLGALDPDERLTALDQKIHGELLLGHQGSWIVELAASWAIVMIATGLYLWWPRDARLAGVIWPRLYLRGRPLWRDLHAVAGFWVSSLALVLLFTGLPWADAWGHAFKAVRAEFGLVKGKQDWTLGGRAPDADDGSPHAGHDHAAMMAMPGMAMPMDMKMPMTGPSGGDALFDLIVGKARGERLAFPVLISPPGGKHGGWTVKSDSQNRPERITINYDKTGREKSRETFSDKHVVDRVVGYGIAWHEGQLFGLVNQIIGTATAIALIFLSISGFIMWRKRKPVQLLGAPPTAERSHVPTGLKLLFGVFLVWLPLFTASLAALWLFDRLALPRLPRAARWLGMPVTSN